MTRREVLLAGLTAMLPIPARAVDVVDVLLAGDSHAHQLGPRLHHVGRKRGKVVAVSARGGSSAKQWLKKGWLHRAIWRHDPPPARVLVSLGTNCVKQERLELGDTFYRLAKLCPGQLVVLWPPTRAFDLTYIERGVSDAFAAGANIKLWWPSRPLPVDSSDLVHATDRGLRMWAGELADWLWN